MAAATRVREGSAPAREPCARSSAATRRGASPTPGSEPYSAPAPAESAGHTASTLTSTPNAIAGATPSRPWRSGSIQGAGSSFALMAKRRSLILPAIVAGVLLLVVGAIYILDTASALPSFFPGHQAGSTHHH